MSLAHHVRPYLQRGACSREQVVYVAISSRLTHAACHTTPDRLPHIGKCASLKPQLRNSISIPIPCCPFNTNSQPTTPSTPRRLNPGLGKENISVVTPQRPPLMKYSSIFLHTFARIAGPPKPRPPKDLPISNIHSSRLSTNLFFLAKHREFRTIALDSRLHRYSG
ncbi:hypothetical protein D9756_000923 [Leucocoprinus leucothites]|uniref:Uncharacterized protein n=1 Tax=Leucocoprinus leucothites TaxID=201217 RepID=A0A8H5GG72_9AGAR|nr:hypothetical protein D9756_000923 [Leucoagaricus leucothites]